MTKLVTHQVLNYTDVNTWSSFIHLIDDLRIMHNVHIKGDVDTSGSTWMFTLIAHGDLIQLQRLADFVKENDPHCTNFAIFD
jgi:hypothetical protein